MRKSQLNYDPEAQYWFFFFLFCFVVLLVLVVFVVFGCFCCVQLTSFPIILMDGGTVEPETTAPMPVDGGCGSCSTRSDSESKLILTCDQRCVSFRWSWFFLVKVLPSSLFSSASCVCSHPVQQQVTHDQNHGINQSNVTLSLPLPSTSRSNQIFSRVTAASIKSVCFWGFFFF